MGHTLYVDMRPETASGQNQMYSLRQNASIIYAAVGVVDFYASTTKLATHYHLANVYLTPTPTISSGQWMNLRYRIEASGRAVLYHHTDDGTLPWEVAEADWVWSCTSTYNTYRGADIRFSVNRYEAIKYNDVDRIYYTANGAVPSDTLNIGLTNDASSQMVRNMGKITRGR